VDALGHLAQQSGGDLLVGGELLQVDGNEELLSLGVDITDINTTLVVEEDPVTLELG
jgi:imidazole glycerol phosphate synthase subunit HisF